MDNSSEQNLKKDLEEPFSNVLYVADLPNETTNDDLQKLFKDYHFHYASLNNFKHNKIWAQVYFENKEWANRARHELNGYILKPMNGANSIKEGKPVRICKYEGKIHNRQNNIKQSLLVKNVDVQMSQKEFYEKFLVYGDIVSGKIEYDENGISKGFGYIYYYTEESAENAKKNLNGKFFYGKALEIVNLIPGKKTKTNSITLFVLNIPNNITEKDLGDIFEKFGPVSNISVNQKGFAYISYANFEGATQCLKELKTNPISFPGLPDVVVKFASSKEERDANKNFIKNNENYNYGMNNLNVQFNSLYYNEEIKTDLDLDQEIRLFIKVVMLMDFSPKEVLVDLDSMSGLVQFEKYHDYNLFFKKYQEHCEKQMPLFQCIPYNFPFPTEENKNDNSNNMYNNNMPMFYGPRSMGPMPGPYNNPMEENNLRNINNNNLQMQARNNNFQNFQNIPQMNNNMNPYPNMQYQQNIPPKNNNKYFNDGNKNMDNGSYGKNRMMNNNYINNNNNNFNNINMNRNMNFNNQINMNNNNRRFNQRNNFGVNFNNNKNNNMRNNNNNNNKKYIFRPEDNFNLANMKLNMLGVYPMNPFMRPPNMMQMKQRNRNIPNMNKNYMMNDYDDMNQKNEIDIIAQRNLATLNPSQLHSQFNKPPINVYANMLDSKEQEEIRMEIADSIYEIVSAKYPLEASKITGMINEKGIEKMNMLLSKKEDLEEIIDRAYEMIKNSKKENEKNSG